MDKYYRISVLDEAGNWYDNAFIENTFDAINVANFYRMRFGYQVKLYDTYNRDITKLLDEVKSMRVVPD